jgi:hypothetical protein
MQELTGSYLNYSVKLWKEESLSNLRALIASDDWQRLPLEPTFKINEFNGASITSNHGSDSSGDFSDEMLEGEIFQGRAGESEKNLQA